MPPSQVSLQSIVIVSGGENLSQQRVSLTFTSNLSSCFGNCLTEEANGILTTRVFENTPNKQMNRISPTFPPLITSAEQPPFVFDELISNSNEDTMDNIQLAPPSSGGGDPKTEVTPEKESGIHFHTLLCS